MIVPIYAKVSYNILHLPRILDQQNCFLSSAKKNLRYFTKNKPVFAKTKKIVAIIQSSLLSVPTVDRKMAVF
jgi:hypothetical protein